MRFDQLFVKAVFIAALLAAVPLGTAQAQVAVTSATPSSAPQGTVALDVEIAGSGFDSSAQVDFLLTGTTNPGGITVKKVVVRGSKKLIATIDVADDASVADFDIQVTLSGGRKGKGITLFKVQAKVTNANDPCADPALDFPAFIYWQQNSTNQEVFVADAEGKCSRSVFVLENGVGDAASFSYPVAGTTNVGRIAWPAAGPDNYGNAIGWIDFTVNEADRTIQSWPARSMLVSRGTGGVELNKDGTKVYFGSVAGYPDSPPIVSVASVGDSSTEQEVYRGAAIGQSVFWIGVSNDETTMVIEEIQSSPDFYRAVMVDLECIDGTSCRRVIAENGVTISWLWPAVDDAGSTIAYSAYQDGSNNCWLLTYLDTQGNRLYEGTQARYGTKAVWLDGKILANGVTAPSRRNKCSRTDSIVKIDPATGSEVTLVRGYGPDAR